MGETSIHLKKCRHILTVVLLSAALAQEATTNEVSPTESPTDFCYGAEYTDEIGGKFTDCAKNKINDISVSACEPTFQEHVEFAIANELYQKCSVPTCVYFSLEVAFRWLKRRSCYLQTYNNENMCWKRSNNFFKNGNLEKRLKEICFETAAPSKSPSLPPTPHPSRAPSLSPTTLLPTRSPSRSPSRLPTPAPSKFPTQITQGCEGVQISGDLLQNFEDCGSQTFENLSVRTCGVDVQDELSFAIANELYTNCSSPQCVYASLDYAFWWDKVGECYKAIPEDGNQTECWEDDNSKFFTSGNLSKALGEICSYPTYSPTYNTTTTPTGLPTPVQSVSPTSYSSPIPTAPTPLSTVPPTVYTSPMPTSTLAPTADSTSNPTANLTDHTLNQTLGRTPTPTLAPTQDPTESPSEHPTGQPTQRPTLTTESPTSVPTPPSNSVLISAKIHGITEMQIEQTIEPLRRVLNNSEWMINIATYSAITSNLADKRRLEVIGFLIHYIVDFLQKHEAEELRKIIMSGSLIKEFAEELATEFDISQGNITVDSIIATGMTGNADTTSRGLVGWILGLVFCILCICLLVIICVLGSRYKKVIKSQSLGKDARDKELKTFGNSSQIGEPTPMDGGEGAGTVGDVDVEEGSSSCTSTPTTPPMCRGSTVDFTNLQNNTSKSVFFGVDAGVAGTKETNGLLAETQRGKLI